MNDDNLEYVNLDGLVIGLDKSDPRYLGNRKEASVALGYAVEEPIGYPMYLEGECVGLYSNVEPVGEIPNLN